MDNLGASVFSLDKGEFLKFGLFLNFFLVGVTDMVDSIEGVGQDFSETVALDELALGLFSTDAKLGCDNLIFIVRAYLDQQKTAYFLADVKILRNFCEIIHSRVEMKN